MGNKKVLYIGTPFFNYHKQIIAEFEEQGFLVDFYNDRPSENSFLKGMLKIRRSMMNSLVIKYFEKIMSETEEIDYDLVFIVNCKVFTPDMIKKLRNRQKSAKFVLYMWDSFTLYPNSEELIPIFDRVYSFDTDDCEKIDSLTFLPLFYGKTYEYLGQGNDCEREFDIVSVCTAHPNRYKTIQALFPLLESKGVRIFSYMFLNRLQYLYNKARVPEFKNAKGGEFKFFPLSDKEHLSVLKKSKTVFDIPHDKQSGLTMRTIETLGAKRKLITTNMNIKKYDFYNENNIFVLEKHNLADIEEFLLKGYEPIKDEIYKKYSLQSWISTIVNQEENKYIKI